MLCISKIITISKNAKCQISFVIYDTRTREKKNENII